MFGFSDIIASELVAASRNEMRVSKLIRSPTQIAGLHAGNLSACMRQDELSMIKCVGDNAKLL